VPGGLHRRRRLCDGVVYVGGAGPGGTLDAIDVATGAPTWTAPVTNGDDRSPAVDEYGVHVSDGCGVTRRFDRMSGVRDRTRTTGFDTEPNAGGCGSDQRLKSSCDRVVEPLALDPAPGPR
jgi:hypothetical protein